MFIKKVNSHKKKLKEYFKLAFQRREVHYKKPDVFLHTNKITNIFSILRFPNLQNLPYIEYGYIRNDIREPLKNAAKGIDVWNILTSHQSKSIRNWCDSEKKFTLLRKWGCLFKNPDACLLFLKNIENRNNYTYEYSINQDTFKFFTQHYDENEYSFVSSMFEGVSTSLSTREVLSFINDTFNMVNIIKDNEPGFIVPKIKNIRVLHDLLSMKMHRSKERNIIYGYSETEKNLEMINEEFSVHLVKDSYELYDIGSSMNHCVYSYKDAVKYKRCLILLFKGENLERVCIELRGKSIYQAKCSYNRHPGKKETLLLKEWARKKGLVIDTYDLRTA
jgi:hypothetical protein